MKLNALKNGVLISFTAAIVTFDVEVQAAPVIITFDELPFQSVDGLSFKGVTYDFKIDGEDSLDASFNDFGPGNLTFVQDSSLVGDIAGILTLDFAEAVNNLEFGVALDTFRTVASGVEVELFDRALSSLGITPIETSSLIEFSEGLFSYSGAPVLRAVVDFNEKKASRFAFDNLSYTIATTPDTGVETPEPFPGLLGMSIVALGMRKRKQAAE
jgi:hypothetical protein